MSTENQPLPEDASLEVEATATSPWCQLHPLEQRYRLKELAQVFFKLGMIAFGGPAAHIAMMDDEVVKRRQWFDRERLLDLIGVTNLLPGPNSTELAIHIGYERAGWKGLFVAGTCFILPAMVMVWILAAVYDQYRALPEVGWLLYGIKPVVMAIILQALVKLGKKAIKDTPTGLAAVGVIVGYFFGFNEILLLIGAGLAVMVIENLRSNLQTGAWLLPVSGLVAQAGGAAPAAVEPSPGWAQIFWLFLKIGSVLYGSGYVLLAFLQRDLVERYQWLTSQELLDAIAIGQFTPGPVFTTATFVGYLVGGNGGAIAATIGIFLPAFLLVGIVNPWVDTLRRSRWFGPCLNGVNAASLGLMGAVTYTLGREAIVDWLTLGLVVVSAIAVFRFKVNSAWIVLAGGLIGFLAHGI